MKCHKDVHIEANRREYGETYHAFKWISDTKAREAGKEREEILEFLRPSVQVGYRSTKLDCRRLSPGCLSCGGGAWSCLFINSICNAACFYCPTEQPSKSEPTTNGIQFTNPQDYGDYIERFRFRGVSLSGGEPLMTFDRTLHFLSRIKKRFGAKVYLWIYTNGIPATPERLRALKDAGLDEIRFDISAGSYDLNKVREAVGIIDTVTVEIPAIPEDVDLLRLLLTRLKEMGVQYLNLHQLRATPYNAGNLIRRGYTFLHGPKVTVLESELAALRTIQYAVERGVGLPINYCSFVYKNGYQTLAYRKRLASFLCKPFESITAAGAVRRTSLKGQPGQVDEVVQILRKHGCNDTLWRLEDGGGRLTFHPSLWFHIDIGRFSLSLDYYLPFLSPAVSYRHGFVEIPLSRHKTVILERRPVLNGRILTVSEAKTFEKWFLADGDESTPAEKDRDRGLSRDDTIGEGTALPEDLSELERIRPGLQEYY